MSADDSPDPLSGYVRLGVLDMPALLAASIMAEADARGVPWQDVVNGVVAEWELRRHRRRRRGG